MWRLFGGLIINESLRSTRYFYYEADTTRLCRVDVVLIISFHNLLCCICLAITCLTVKNLLGSNPKMYLWPNNYVCVFFLFLGGLMINESPWGTRHFYYEDNMTRLCHVDVVLNSNYIFQKLLCCIVPYHVNMSIYVQTR